MRSCSLNGANPAARGVPAGHSWKEAYMQPYVLCLLQGVGRKRPWSKVPIGALHCWGYACTWVPSGKSSQESAAAGRAPECAPTLLPLFAGCSLVLAVCSQIRVSGTRVHSPFADQFQGDLF